MIYLLVPVIASWLWLAVWVWRDIFREARRGATTQPDPVPDWQLLPPPKSGNRKGHPRTGWTLPEILSSTETTHVQIGLTILTALRDHHRAGKTSVEFAKPRVNERELGQPPYGVDS